MNAVLGARRTIAAAAVLLFAPLYLSAQASGTAAAGTQQAAADVLPPGEESPLQNPVYRFEIITLGSFPFTLFYTGFVFDMANYVSNGFDSAYAPWPFQSEYSASLTTSDRLVRIGVALSVSAVIGAIDAVIHANKMRAAKQLRFGGIPVEGQ
jgi:hypothetical protein